MVSLREFVTFEQADERLTISVGRDTAKEARDALAWFQLGQSAPVTIDVEEDCLWVYLDECSISIGVTAETGDEIYVRTSVRQYDVGAYLTEQTQFDAAPLDDEDHDAIVDTVTELMQNLTGFHYLAGGAAVRAIHAEEADGERLRLGVYELVRRAIFGWED